MKKICNFFTLLLLTCTPLLSAPKKAAPITDTITTQRAREAAKKKARFDALPEDHYLRKRVLLEKKLFYDMQRYQWRAARALKFAIDLEKPDHVDYVLLLHGMLHRGLVEAPLAEPDGILIRLITIEHDPQRKELIQKAIELETAAEICSDAKAARQVIIEEFQKKLKTRLEREQLLWNFHWDQHYNHETFRQRDLC